MTESMSTPDQPSLRQSASQATRERLLSAATRLLERGEECSMRSVAAEAAVSERTIYRYFENLEAMQEAILGSIMSRGWVPLPASSEELEDYAQALFDMFDSNAELITGLAALASSSLRQMFTKTRRKNLDSLQALLSHDFPQAPQEDRHAAALSLRGLLSGGNWTYLRISCGLPQEEIVHSARWAIRRALDHLRCE